jgi:uncharacterized protein YbaR (Trm112 family)
VISKALLEMLVCPIAKLPLAPAGKDLLAELNRRIAAGSITNRSGVTVEEPLTDGLAREDGEVLYPVRDDIPIMLADEAILLDQLQ